MPVCVCLSVCLGMGVCGSVSSVFTCFFFVIVRVTTEMYTEWSVGSVRGV